MKCVINKRFMTRTERTPRVLEIAEAFGLGLEDREFVVFDNFQLDVNPGDVVYITGQSGSGKSLLLRELAKQLATKYSVSDIDTVELLDAPLSQQLGKNTDEANRLLVQAGLGDAYLFIRKPQELSDGQRYRLRIAKLLENHSTVWVADEFGAVLDRETAKLVAFNLQKQSRKHNAIVIVATTHRDLKQELGPSIYVEKNYREKIKVELIENAKGEIVLRQEPSCAPT